MREMVGHRFRAGFAREIFGAARLDDFAMGEIAQPPVRHPAEISEAR